MAGVKDAESWGGWLGERPEPPQGPGAPPKGPEPPEGLVKTRQHRPGKNSLRRRSGRRSGRRGRSSESPIIWYWDVWFHWSLAPQHQQQ